MYYGVVLNFWRKYSIIYIYFWCSLILIHAQRDINYNYFIGDVNRRKKKLDKYFVHTKVE
jgi:hypothetical protein